MNLGDLVDLEWRILRDEERSREGERDEIVARDRRIGHEILAAENLDPARARLAIEEDPELRRRVALAWLDRVRAPDERTPGRRLWAGYRLAGWILAVLFLFFGAGAARAVLSYEGENPVNVFYFIAALILTQVALLTLMILFLTLHGLFRGGDFLGGMQSLIVRIGRMRFVDRFVGGSAADAARAVGAFRARHSLYGDVERWTLFQLTQRCGVFFNVAALATALWLVVFSDLAFGWSTTLDVEADQVHSVVAALAAPWEWAAPSAVPDADLVRATRWVRGPVEGHYVGARPGVEIPAATWWRFLVLGLFTWGFLPRFTAFLVGRWRARRALRRVHLDHVGFQRLFERLAPPAAAWIAPAPESVGFSPPPEAGTSAAAGAVATAGAGRCRVLLWGALAGRAEGVEDRIEARFGWPADASHAVGGADLAGDDRALAAIEAAKARRVVLVVEAGNQPTREVVSLLADVRRRTPERTPIVVALLGAEPDEVDQWRHRLDQEADPWLRVEGLPSS